jgi:hypothetical protein
MRTVADILLGVRLHRCWVIRPIVPHSRKHLRTRPQGEHVTDDWQYLSTDNPDEYVVLHRRATCGTWYPCRITFQNTASYEYELVERALPSWVDTTPQEPDDND